MKNKIFTALRPLQSAPWEVVMMHGRFSVGIWACEPKTNTITWLPLRPLRRGWPLAPLLLLALVCFTRASSVQAQTTATLSGTVQDSVGAVIPGAQVTLSNEVTGESRVEETNGAGLYAFPSLVPGNYNLKASAKGFKSAAITGIVLNAGDTRAVPTFNLGIGAATETVTISATSEMIPVENGQKIEVLSQADIQNLALEGRDTSELLRVLPGTTVESGGLTQTSPAFSDLNVTVDESAIGNGYDINGAVNRGGTAILSDGADMIDVGNMASSLTIIAPEMTAEVSVQASNLSADQPFGPVVVSTISKSGSANYHGEGYFNARNSVLNANSWQAKNQVPQVPLGAQHYYYPGGSFGGPVPFTHKKLLFWAGYERWLQNQGNQNILSSYIPTPEMMQGDFSMDNADNAALCPKGFFQGKPPGGYPGGSWCSDLGGTVLANGATTTTLPTPAATGTVQIGTTSYTVDNGQKFPGGFLDPGAAALSKIWPAAQANPAITPQGQNYYAPIDNINNGWIYRVRLDYQLGDNTKIYGSYQQAYSSQLAQGNGAHLYWTPGNAIPYPGGGEPENSFGKTMAGHIVHNFNSTTTADFMAAWAFGSYPFIETNQKLVERGALGYPDSYGKVFAAPSGQTLGGLNIPAYNSAGNETFPDFSQDSIFENPKGSYAVKKEAPQFALTLTKVWGPHTIKMGGFTQTTDNFQSTFSSYLDGDLQFAAGQSPDLVNTGNTLIGSPQNATANFVNGIASSYSENNAAPIQDLAEMSTAAFVDDTWKVKPRLNLELGIRIEHVGHWYDRGKTGVPVFYPQRVLSDYFTGKYAPGYYWHAIDAGVPLSGQPNRFAYADPRLGVSYDVFGKGNTVVRGGWGIYRFVTQVNTIQAALQSAQDVLGSPSLNGHRLQLQNIHNLAYSACPSVAKSAPCGVQAGQTGLDPTDYGQPITYAYNFTIDQRLPWNSQLEIGYVGSKTSQLVDDGEDIEGSNFSELANQNKTPIGALFQADPKTGVTATNPENVTENPNLTSFTGTPTGNTLADYHPYGLAYGTSGVFMIQNIGYGNYNALQGSWVKTTGRLTFNLNATWSKTLATALQTNPYVLSANYGPPAIDRPLVFNASYTYNSGTLHYGSQLINQLGSGWTISGISTWQKGGYIPAALGNGVPNFGLGLQYINQPKDPSSAGLAKDTGVGTGIGNATYFGTDENIPILPVLTCNPTQGLASHQVLNGKCFAAPTVGSQGGQNFPYMNATPYFDNDLALYRTFHIHEKQNVQLRASAFDWLNHSLLEFAGSNYYSTNYNVDYNSKAITPNFNQGSTGANAFGLMTVRSQLPYARIIELDVKYSF